MNYSKKKCCIAAFVMLFVMLVGSVSVYASNTTYKLVTGSVDGVGGFAGESTITSTKGKASTSSQDSSLANRVDSTYYSIPKSTLDTSKAKRDFITGLGIGSAKITASAGDNYVTWKLVSSHRVIFNNNTWVGTTTTCFEY